MTQHPVGRLDISVGMPYHEGAKLKAAVEWAEARFNHLIISVADTLQRHNYMAEGMDQEAAYNLSYRKGAEWIKRNRSIIKGASIIRWDQRLTHPLYNQFMVRTKVSLESDLAFYESLRTEAVG